MSNELTLQEAALAWAQGKKVEANKAYSKWGLIIQPGCSAGEGEYYPNIFMKENCCASCFRLAPEPPAKRYRPWTPGEVPVGAWFRVGSQELHCWMITGWNTAGFFTSNQNLGLITFDEAVSSDRRHSTDNGKTWRPCGVEVES